MIHFYRYLAALTVLLIAFSAYAVTVAPWLASPPVARASVPTEVTVLPVVSGLRAEWAELFPADAWERQNPKVVETQQCTLLIQDYRTTDDGRLELTPCTLILHASSGNEASGAAALAPRSSRPIVLQAPKAELVFDRALDLTRAEFGRVEKGTLSGEIRIYSPPTQPGGRDALEVRTRAVWLDRQAIRTANDVEFQYGDSTGRGRDLEITLLQPASDPSPADKAKLRGVQAVTLKHLDYLRVVMPGSGLLGEGPRPKPATPLTALQASAGTPPLEITCQGEFAFDVPRQVARFQDRVKVRRLLAGSPPDALDCDELLLGLGERVGEGPKSKVQGSGSEVQGPRSDDPLGGRLRRIIAIGSPAVLVAPSRGVHAEAAWMEYSLVERSIQLKSDPARNVRAVSLRQYDQHFTAPELHYQFPVQKQFAEEKLGASGRLGRLHATGPGELRLLQGRANRRQVVTARWERALEIRPQEQNQVISLLDAASVQIDPLGRFDANELHLWVLEVAEESGPTVPVGPLLVPRQPTPIAESNEPPSRSADNTTILPDRLLAVGKVRMASTQLDVDTSRLEAWFHNLPPDAPQPGPPRGIDGRIREPVAPVAYAQEIAPAATIQNTIRQPSWQKFHVAGGVIRTQLVVRGQQFDLEDLSIRGQAEIDETRTPEPGLEPLRVRGDFIELRHGTRPDATVEASGLPAEMAGRGMTLAGGKIEFDRAKNELRIEGPGEATLPPGKGGQLGAPGSLLPLPGGGSSDAATGQTPVAREKLHLVWQQGLLFDGLTARFQGDVIVRTAEQTAHTPVLEAKLNRRLDFQASAGQPAVALARVVLDGGGSGVYIESHSHDEFGELQSRSQVKVRNVLLDQESGAVHAQGPGWLSTVRRGAGFGGQGTEDGRQRTGDGGQPLAAQSRTITALRQPLTSIHVAFEREMAGDLNQRWIEFRQQVQTTYSPATDFGDVIAADPLGKLGEQMALMRSDTLRITETSIGPTRAFELRAQGGTTVEGQNFFVDSPIVSYTSDKEVLTIEGDGRAIAKLSMKQPARNLEGQRFWYNLRTGNLQMDAVKMQFNLSPNPQLPGRAQR